MQQKIEQKFFVFKIIASELVTVNCLYSAQDTFHQQKMCWEAVTGHGMSIRETFSNSIDLRVINECDKGAMIKILAVLGRIYNVASRTVLWNGAF